MTNKNIPSYTATLLSLKWMEYHKHSLNLKHINPKEFTKDFENVYIEISSYLNGPISISEKFRMLQKRNRSRR